MADAYTTAALLEIDQKIEDLRAAMPQRPITELSRESFERLNPAARMDAMRRGITIYDGAAPAKPKLPAGAIIRSDFDKLSAPERHRLIIGGKVAVYD